MGDADSVSLPESNMIPDIAAARDSHAISGSIDPEEEFPSMLFAESTSVTHQASGVTSATAMSNVETSDSARFIGPSPMVSDVIISCSKDVKDPNALAGNCGLYNLGNTCFMNSGLQSLLGNARLVNYFLNDFQLTEDNQDMLVGQFCLLLQKTWLGDYSLIYPLMLKQTLGLYYSQFRDYRQHDCSEFLTLLLDTLHEQLNSRQLQPPNNATANDEKLTLTGTASTSSSEQSTSKSQFTGITVAVSSSAPTGRFIARASKTGDTDLVVDSKASSSDSSIGGEPAISVIGNSLNADSTMSTSPSLLPTSQFSVISEDSNQSNLSGQSSDSESSVGISMLNLKSKDSVKGFCVSSTSEIKSQVLSGAASSRMHSVIEEEANIISSSSPKRQVEEMLQDDDVNELNDNTEEASEECASSETDTTPVPTQILNNARVNATRSKRLPTFDDLYAKDTKILNTNVLATEFMHELVKTDSEKFLKPENTNRPQELIDNLSDILHVGEKKDGQLPSASFVSSVPYPATSTGVKATNIEADRRTRLMKNNVTSSTSDSDECFRANNVKRMKFEGTEKNLKRQALHKFNVDKNFMLTMLEMDSAPTTSNQCDESDTESVTEEIEMLSNLGASEDYGEVDEGMSSVSRSSPVESISSAVIEDDTNRHSELADRAWMSYLENNRSVIVDTFQGQFQSTVICSECNHVSVTYEPFMYLSLPLPRAMERQICVIYIPVDGSATRYLFTLNKNDNVSKLKQELHTLIKQDSGDIIMAEVYNNHISRILDEGILLRYVNDSSRTIYAFQMNPVSLVHQDLLNIPPIETETTVQSDVRKPDTSIDQGQQCNNESTTQTSSSDIFSSMGTFSTEENVSDSCFQTDEELAASMQQEEYKMNLDNEMGFQRDSCEMFSDIRGTAVWGNQSRIPTVVRDKRWSPGMTMNDIPSTSSNSSGATSAAVTTTLSGSDTCLNYGGIAQQWRTCAICLEELLDSDLMIHMACGGTLCHNCLQMSMKHYGEIFYVCPVCSISVKPTEDFVPLSACNKNEDCVRLLAVPIAHRLTYKDTDDGHLVQRILGFPRILYLPSQLIGHDLYNNVTPITPFPSNYTVVLTDGQGLHCSRCDYTENCTGCTVSHDSKLTLQPGDNLTIAVHENDITKHELEDKVEDDASMENLRSADPLTISECFQAFSESETLDEHNPWFCPRCIENQPAKKTISVWRYPDTLIIYLKRFVFHELSSTKIDCKVVYPFENLDLSTYLSGPSSLDHLYDLHSIICHFGGSSSGHYTAYTRHPVTTEWYYYNDETMFKRIPHDDDYSSAYILFYQRKGTSSTINLPPKLNSSKTLDDSEPSSTTCSHAYPTSSANQDVDCDINHCSKDSSAAQVTSDTAVSNSSCDAMMCEADSSCSTSYDFYC